MSEREREVRERGKKVIERREKSRGEKEKQFSMNFMAIEGSISNQYEKNASKHYN